MATVSGKPRQRAWKPKARSGCKTCKIRKVKCDEEKPNCRRCTSTGRTCDGYDPTFRPPPPSTPSPPESSKSSPQSVSSWSLTRSHSPVFIAPAIRLDTKEERDSFEFFMTHAVSNLRGFLDSPFWQRELLQAAHREPAIQHCIIALGAMYRRFSEGCDSRLTETAILDNYLQFALRQSNQAIQDLLKKPKSNDKVVKSDKITLMTCAILFTSMCCLQGYQRDAIEHVRSGIRMLNEVDQGKEKFDHPIELESIRTIFVGFDTQIRAIMPTHISPSWVAKPKTRPLGSSTNTLSMSALHAMLGHTQSLLNSIHAFNQRTKLRPADEVEEVYIEYLDLISRYHRGKLTMDNLWKQAPAYGEEYTEPLTALELTQAQMEFLLRAPRADLIQKFPCLGDFKPARKPFIEPFDMAAQFVLIFELAAKLLPLSGAQTPIFQTPVGPTSALWAIAVRAPSSCQALRKRAVKLMLSHPRREGFWDGMLAGQIAEEALRLEQERARAEMGIEEDEIHAELEVPEHLRIIAFYLTHPKDSDRTVKVEFSDARDLAIGIPGSVKWITW
ncbi:uncharacterized protein J4E79_004076 [Alternaria viburni]|nr:uncharacterized protein J4E79_004076 [Alternaria viburni]KAI4662767.1 hypothetical protein J4E79_004076 [Alternaria viburni]